MEQQPQQPQPARVRASTVATIGLIGLVIGFMLGALTYKRFNPCVELPVVAVEADTVIVRDTMRLPVPEATDNGIKRRDTVWIKIKPVDTTKVKKDTSTPLEPKRDTTGVRLEENGAITIPIEEKVYKTDDYKAVVQGWRPSLVSMEVYPKTTTITNTVTRLQRPRWGLTAGVGGGYDGSRIVPHVGFTVGYVIWSR